MGPLPQMNLRVLALVARRRGRWEILGRPELLEVLPYRGAGAREALEGLAAFLGEGR